MTEPVAQARALVELGIREAQRRGFNDTYTFTNDYIRLCQSEMRDNAAAYPRLIRRPLARPFRTIPRWLFIGYLSVAYAAANAATLPSSVRTNPENTSLRPAARSMCLISSMHLRSSNRVPCSSGAFMPAS